MTDIDDDFRNLMEQVRSGSEEAAWELVKEYGDADPPRCAAGPAP